MKNNLTIFDVLLPPIYILASLIYGYWVTKKNIREKPEYKYFLNGLVVRIFGAIALGLVYHFYYGGGDTINYHQTASAYANLIYEHSDDFWRGWLGNGNNYFFPFNEMTGYPVYKPADQHSFFVVRLLIPIVMLGFHSYFASAVLVATITYGGMWKLYQTFLLEFPQLKKEFAIAVLFHLAYFGVLV